MEREKHMSIQPCDLMKMLNIQNDRDFDLVTKSCRLLFDLLCYLGEGSELVVSNVKFVKTSNVEVLASDGIKGVSFEVKPDTDIQRVLEELIDAASEVSGIKLPI